MKREDFDIAAGVVDRIDKIEKKIFELQSIITYKGFKILAYKHTDFNFSSDYDTSIDLIPNDISTEIFIQDVLEYYINTLNLELNDLKIELEGIGKSELNN